MQTSLVKGPGPSPENLGALRNAAKFFLLKDRELAEELLQRGQQRESENPRWYSSLGQIYSLGLTSLPIGANRTATATKAFEQYELAYERASPTSRSFLLSDLATTALEAGKVMDASKFAERMLDNDAAGWNRGDRVHHGNLILGRIALARGDTDEAKSRLLLAGQTEGSPQLNSFGPNMLLAKELLERDETEVVLEYFELCKSSGARQGETWSNGSTTSNQIEPQGSEPTWLTKPSSSPHRYTTFKAMMDQASQNCMVSASATGAARNRHLPQIFSGGPVL